MGPKFSIPSPTFSKPSSTVSEVTQPPSYEDAVKQVIAIFFFTENYVDSVNIVLYYPNSYTLQILILSRALPTE